MRQVRNDIIVDQGQDSTGQLRIAARILRCRGVDVGGADRRNLLGDFGGGESEFQRAAVLLCRGGQSASPLAVDRVDRQAGDAARLEQVAGAKTGAAERRVRLTRQAQQAAVDDGIADLPQEVLAPLGHRIGFVPPRSDPRRGNPF